MDKLTNVNVRFGNFTLAKLDALVIQIGEDMGESMSRSSVIRLAVNELARKHISPKEIADIFRNTNTPTAG